MRSFVGALLALAAAAAVTDVDGVAGAAEENLAPPNSPTTRPSTPIAWGLRTDTGVGVGALPGSGGIAGVVGYAGEVWLSKYLGIGAQLGLEYLASISLGSCGSGCSSASALRVSLGPAVTLRGSSTASFPFLSLSLGVAIGTSRYDYSCESYVVNCPVDYWHSDAPALSGTLVAAWLFHPGGAIGPLIRADCFKFGDSSYGSPGSGAVACAFTTGVTMGLGGTRRTEGSGATW